MHIYMHLYTEKGIHFDSALEATIYIYTYIHMYVCAYIYV